MATPKSTATSPTATNDMRLNELICDAVRHNRQSSHTSTMNNLQTSIELSNITNDFNNTKPSKHRINEIIPPLNICLLWIAFLVAFICSIYFVCIHMY